MPRKKTNGKSNGKARAKKPKHPEKCSYEDGPCEAMARYAHPGAADRGKGIFAMSNIMNVRTLSAKMYHKGFFFRSDYTEKNGIMLYYCPWCGADLGKWYEAFAKDFNADADAFDKKHPDAGEKRAKAKTKFEKERQEFIDKLDPEVRDALRKLNEKQREALLESWMRDGRFLHGAPGVHPNTVESICRKDRGLVSKGRTLNDFGIKVRKAAQEIPSGYVIPV